jgi:Tol biopolymer transport system component
MAYDSIGEGDEFDIFVIDWDGQNRVNITESPISERYPVWSPDGSRIIYVSSTIETRQILSSEPDGSDRVQHLSFSKVNNPSAPNWSPDGSQLTFTGYDDNMNPAYVYVANLDGSSLAQVTNSALDSHTPAFSRDGLWIAFAKEVTVPDSFGGNTNPNIFLIKPNGSGEFWLAKDVESSQTFPVWSPLGNWIAYNSYEPLEETDIYIVKPDGTLLTNVTNTPDILKWWPAWRVVQ